MANSCIKTSAYAFALVCFSTIIFAGVVRAQDGAEPPVAPNVISSELKPITPKTVVMVFDVTASTKSGGVFAREREATADILRDGCSVGDRVVLLKFGTAYSVVFDTVLREPADAIRLVQKIPTSVEPGHGTNIRWPHSEALQIVKDDLPHPGRIILLTDSYNDGPDPKDPNMRHYEEYYSPKGLTVYPRSSANSRYESLLRTLKSSGKLKQYGVGVSIARSGRPIERLPVGPGQGDDSNTAAEPTTTFVPMTADKSTPSKLPWILLGIAILVAALAAWRFLSGKPQAVRLAVGTKGLPRDFRLAPGSQIGLGGPSSGTLNGAEILPLLGVAAPAAWIRAERGGLTVTPAEDSKQPATTPAPTVGGTATEPVRVFHNGMRLTSNEPLNIDDELRLVVPATDAAPEREYRVRVIDPKSSLF